MADGQYTFRECVVDGSVVIGSIAPNQLMNRPWSFYVNRPPVALSQLDNGQDARKIVRGYDGALLYNGTKLATVNTWTATLNFANEHYQEPGNRQAIAIPMSFTCQLQFTEAVTRDADFLARVLAMVNGGQDVTFDFTGFIKGR